MTPAEAALAAAIHARLHRWPVSASFDHGDLALEGEVESDRPAGRRGAEPGAKAPGRELGVWVPGTRDVVNGLGVSPPEEDSDDEISDALRMVLEKDPLLRGLRIGVTTDQRVVTLMGTVQTDQRRRAAEYDGWCLFGVDRVVSRLQVRPR